MATTKSSRKKTTVHLALDLTEYEVLQFKILAVMERTSMKGWLEGIVREHVRRLQPLPASKFPVMGRPKVTPVGPAVRRDALGHFLPNTPPKEAPDGPEKRTASPEKTIKSGDMKVKKRA